MPGRMPRRWASGPFLRASTAIGQGELLASPLNMALVAATVVNHGDLPRPHLIRAIRAPSGSLLHGEPSGAWLAGAMSPPVADQVRAMMLDVVQEGTGVQAAVPGLTVGGKTGTAQVSGAAAPHAWFIGFAQQDQRAIAIAVIVENGGEGSEVAAPIFAEVARAAAGYVKGE